MMYSIEYIHTLGFYN